MSVKRMIEKKVSMAAYDNIKLQKKARNLFTAVKDVEKTLDNFQKKGK